MEPLPVPSYLSTTTPPGVDGDSISKAIPLQADIFSGITSRYYEYSKTWITQMDKMSGWF
jgi:hypothetical protein